ncbi:zinc finger MYM-type protein 4 isoform X1 [Carassius auratus]|uniref:Zinc finger MYM-type protein 4 isoform X1 n=2 Tax=Carassius auratus TaxID=7957 RepID=A0A6P6RGN9_CARAU|nr:zinc finger MYM-type protein 4-like isoform X1 [Carassius auratus]
MVNYCVYGGCTNCSQSGHRVHRFPDKKKHGDIFSAWVRFVQAKRRNFTSASATKNAVVCSVHFTPEDYRPEDIMEVNMGCKSKNQVRLRVDAVPSVHIAASSGHPSAARRHVGHKWPNFVLKRVTSGPSQSTETVSPLGSTSVAVARLVIMASEDSIEQLPGVAAGSDVKPDAVESCLLAATEAGEDEPSLQNSIMETQKVEQEEVEKLPEEMKEDPDVIQQSGVDQQNGPEKNSVTEKKVEENCAQDHSEQKNAGEVKKKEVRNNAEDAAHCSEELVIAKVEDFTSEMAIDVDQAEDCDGKMEVDASDDAGKSLPEPIKREKTEPPVVQTLSVLKTEVNPQVARLSDALSVKVKDEPMDEEYEKASVSLRPVGNIKDEPDPAAEVNQTPDSIKISAVFSVGGNATSIVPPAAPAKVPTLVPTLSLPSLTPANPIGVVCTGCNKVLLKGQTAFQRKGCPKLYCSPQCLCTTSNVVVKLPQKKQCHHCHKDILDLKDVINAPVDMSGTVKEFCSQKCLSALSFKCSVCHKTGMTYTHEVNLMGSVHKLCSNSCFNQFRSSNKLNMNSCMNCGGYCSGTDSQCPSLLIESSVMKFCKQNCLVAFKKKSLKPVSCKICHTMRPVAEMVESPNMQGVKELFCSSSCVTANKVQTVSSSGVPVECNSCKLKLTPQYHLAMSDGTIQNFCSFSCVVSYQESFSKIKPVMAINTATSTSNNTLTTKPHAPKRPAESSSPAKTSTSSGPPQTATKIPCSQCLKSFYHRPELLEFKRKMYAFCDNSCVEEFKQINNIMARCEYCKIDKVVKEVKRINKIDRSFCSEGCKLLYKHDLVKRWGKKHCRNCYYCSGSAQALVTEVIDMVEQEFCGNICLSQHRLLMRKEIKCSMCRQAKKMTETVKWLGEIKHFCSLQCLMFFCSLQGTTGPVRPANKTLSTQGTSPEPSPGPQTTVNHTQLVTKEAAPVIASVLSLSSASNGQPGVLGSRVLQASVPAATAKGSGNTASTQTDGAKFFAPAPRILKNKALLCKPLSQNKGTSCKPNVCDMNTQTDGPSVIVLPVPVPIYVPLPMNLYTQYTPKSVGLPLPVPVPLFFPTTLDSAERIVKTIQEIKEKIPDDPLEADLIMMAEMVAEDAEKEKSIIITDQTSNIMDDLDLEALSSNLSWEEDSVSSAQTWDQTPEPERPPPPGSATLTPVSTAAEEPQMDLEADFPIERIELFREPTQTETTDSVKRRSRKRKHDGFPQKKRGRKSATVVPVKSALDNLSNLSKLQHEYAVNAWKEWVRWRNAQPNMETPRFGSRSMTLKEDLLKCCTAEISYGLCKFISEVRRPNGEKYSPDSIFYLCLGIQQYLFDNNRMENIFADVFYTKFCQELTNILRGWKPTILPSGYVHSRVEEEYLWDCKQLGAFSPGVLLNTLLYFFTKYFNYKTVEQHRRLSFGHIVRCSRTKGNTKVACLRFYPPKEEASTDGVPAKKRKEEEDENDTVYEIKENADNPLRCPVRLYEFYLSKCSPSVRQRTTEFYLSPERSCVPNSPMWFSTTSLSDDVLDSMLTRILTVRELHLERETSPNESDSESDSDIRP